MERTKTINQQGKTKYVRIDHKTLIEVSVNIPDNVAREHYLKNRRASNYLSKNTPEIAM